MIEFTVHGTPVPQGSIRAFAGNKGVHYTHSNAKVLLPYRELLHNAAVNAVIDQDLLICDDDKGRAAYRVDMEFYFAKPFSLSKNHIHKNTKPDIDKLERAVLDALTHVCFENDSRVTESSTKKAFDRDERTVVRVYKWRDGAWS